MQKKARRNRNDHGVPTRITLSGIELAAGRSSARSIRACCRSAHAVLRTIGRIARRRSRILVRADICIAVTVAMHACSVSAVVATCSVGWAGRGIAVAASCAGATTLRALRQQRRGRRQNGSQDDRYCRVPHDVLLLLAQTKMGTARDWKGGVSCEN